MGKYILTLKDGDTREVKILDAPVYRVEYDGNDKFKTFTEIKNDNDIIRIVDTIEYKFYIEYIGFIRNENQLFELYKSLRNPIIKLEYNQI